MTLGPDARALLDAASGGDDPTFADAARVRSKIAARIAIGAAAGTAATISTKPAAAAAGSIFATTTAKVVLAIAIATGAATATVAATREESTVAATRPAPIATTIARSVAKPAAVAPPRAAEAPPPTATPAPAPAPKKIAPPSAATDQIVEESMLLRRANAALASGDPTTALALVSDHARRFPGGSLSQEREGARAVALCAAGRRSEGAAAAEAFLASSPRSPLAERVRVACGL